MLKKVDHQESLNLRKNVDEFIFVGRDELNLGIDSDIDQYFNQTENFDVVVNCAAYTAVDKAESEQVLANQVNHLAVRKLACIALKQKAKLIHISTDYVFDGKSERPYLESDTTKPINLYGKTKLAGENAIKEVMPNNGIIIRTSWVYSEFGNNFVKTMLRLGREKTELSVICDQIGSPTYASDLADVILNIVRFPNKDHSTEIYNYSNNGEISWYDFALEIFRIEKLNCRVANVTTAKYPATIARRPLNTVLNKAKIYSDFGVRPRSYRSALTECLSCINDAK
tara:strand:- start:183 stop:1034 length:852 start_codon:yes stop_codon:yes gene_type:complete